MSKKLIQHSFLVSSILLLTAMFIHTVFLLQSSEEPITTSNISAFNG